MLGGFLKGSKGLRLLVTAWDSQGPWLLDLCMRKVPDSPTLVPWTRDEGSLKDQGRCKSL